MKVADLLNPRQAIQCIGQVKLVFNVAGDVKLYSRNVFGKAVCELRQAETWKRCKVSLSRGKRLVHEIAYI